MNDPRGMNVWCQNLRSQKPSGNKLMVEIKGKEEIKKDRENQSDQIAAYGS